uniref:Uncharacterized protein n=1 Tax=Peromyscus maniculatus bairdii TaxID=230844 RepID=A0A8C8W5A1_PERMB
MPSLSCLCSMLYLYFLSVVTVSLERKDKCPQKLW